MGIVASIWLGIVIFVATNIDDIVILLGFFADRRFRPTHVLLGQYLGIAILVGISAVGALVSLVIPAAYIGLLGVLPIAIGIKHWLECAEDGEGEATQPRPGPGNVLAIAAVTVANGGDNIAVYTPVFATRDGLQSLVIVLVFVVMIAVWVVIAHWLVNHPTIGAPIRRYGRIATPLILIGLGVLIIVESGVIGALSGR